VPDPIDSYAYGEEGSLFYQDFTIIYEAVTVKIKMIEHVVQVENLDQWKIKVFGTVRDGHMVFFQSLSTPLHPHRCKH
jgi:hypothetical protein